METISSEVSTHGRFVAACQTAEESFSQVIRLAEWSTPSSTGAELLAVLANPTPMPAMVVAELESNQAQATVPADKWV